MVKSLKFSDKKVKLWFKYGYKSYPKVRHIKIDAELLSIMYEIRKNKEVEMYVEHVIDDEWNYEVEAEGYISNEVWVQYESNVSLQDWEFEVGEGYDNGGTLENNVNVNTIVNASMNVNASENAIVNAFENPVVIASMNVNPSMKASENASVDAQNLLHDDPARYILALCIPSIH
nr:uncharacterized protein LOC109151318 [Ipomoea trifida]